MTMQLVFATNNENKIKEIRSMLGDIFEVITLQEAGIDIDIDFASNTEFRQINTWFHRETCAREHPAFPKVRVVTIGECGSHAKIAAQMGPVGGKGSSEQALARRMLGQLEPGWLLIADRGFYNWPDWQAAAATGSALLWRVKADLRLPVRWKPDPAATPKDSVSREGRADNLTAGTLLTLPLGQP